MKNYEKVVHEAFIRWGMSKIRRCSQCGRTYTNDRANRNKRQHQIRHHGAKKNEKAGRPSLGTEKLEWFPRRYARDF